LHPKNLGPQKGAEFGPQLPWELNILSAFNTAKAGFSRKSKTEFARIGVLDGVSQISVSIALQAATVIHK